MAITTLPTQTDGSVGGVKVDGDEFTAAVSNERAVRIVEIFAEVGLSNGATVGSINERLTELAEGAASSTDNAIARFHLATGKVIQNSAVTIDDSGNIATSGTVDGRDVSVDGAKLDGIEAGADVTDATNVAAAGAVMTTRTISTTAPLTGGGDLSANRTLAIPAATSAVDGYATAVQITKLDAIEAAADVTDATNVAAAGAVMDSDFAGSDAGAMIRTGAGAYAVKKHNLSATVSPVVGDDAADGYAVDSTWIDTTNDSVHKCVDSTNGAAVWKRLDANVPVVTSSASTSITVADTDHGKLIRCTAATTITVSVPSGLTSGTTVELVQEGDGQIQLQGSGAPLTLRYPATFDPYTNEKYSTLVVTILDTDEAIVRGDMAAA
jgi:hypothetical protein